MATIFDHLFGSGAQPVQRKGNFRITYDQLGTPTVVAVDAEGWCLILSIPVGTP